MGLARQLPSFDAGAVGLSLLSVLRWYGVLLVLPVVVAVTWAEWQQAWHFAALGAACFAIGATAWFPSSLHPVARRRLHPGPVALDPGRDRPGRHRALPVGDRQAAARRGIDLVELPTEKLHGTRVRDCDMGRHTLLVALRRGQEEVLLAKSDLEIERDDTLIFMVDDEGALEKLIGELRTEGREEASG